MEAICAYAVSGFYGPVYRYLYYALLLLSTIFHRNSLLVSGALGTAMIYSAIATVHAIALAAVRGRGTADLDIIPAFAVTGVGMLAGTPIMIWSKTLREASTARRAVLFAWVVVMWVGLIASVASMKALPQPQACGPGPACGLSCSATLPMRAGQAVHAVPFRWKNFLFDWSGYFTAYGTGFAFLGLVIAWPKTHPFDQARAMLRNRTMVSRKRDAGRFAACAVVGPFLAVGLALAHVVVLEIILMGPRGVPYHKNFSAIGQWGPLVGAAVVQAALVIQQAFAEAPAAHGVQLQDVERGVPRISPQAPLPPPPLPLLPVRPTKRFDYSTVFREGHWWGRGLEGYVMTHEGIRWRVHDGLLRRADDLGVRPGAGDKQCIRRRLSL